MAVCIHVCVCMCVFHPVCEMRGAFGGGGAIFHFYPKLSSGLNIGLAHDLATFRHNALVTSKSYYNVSSMFL